MKAISNALLNHLAGEEITVAMLWKVTRQDGFTLGFTDHDLPIVFSDSTSLGPVTYQPSFGAEDSATSTSSDMNISNQELTAFIESESITESDIFAGKYDYATIEIRLVNWNNLGMGALLWKKATLGEVKTQNGKFTVELRGLEFFLSTNMGETYGPTCRADLGDSRCTINMALYIQNGSVDTVTDLRTFVPNSGLVTVGPGLPANPAPPNWFNGGVLTWLTGANAGDAMEVSSWDGTTIVLFENMPYAVAPGDTFTIEPGCDKSTGTNGCQRFNNIDNFRGEPNIPGMDQILIYPNASGTIPS